MTSTRRTNHPSLDLERYAEALVLEHLHGDAAPRFIATRVRELISLGDIVGAAYWREIGRRYDRLQRRGRLS